MFSCSVSDSVQDSNYDSFLNSALRALQYLCSAIGGKAAIRAAEKTSPAEELVAAAKQNITEVSVTTAKQLLAEGHIVVIDTSEESG
jgi:hypothetical protein